MDARAGVAVLSGAGVGRDLPSEDYVASVKQRKRTIKKGAGAQLTRADFRRLVKLNPPPQSWFDENFDGLALDPVLVKRIVELRDKLKAMIDGCCGDDCGKTFCESYGCKTLLDVIRDLDAALRP